MINITKLYQDFRIPFQSEGGQDVARGWVGAPCPFCAGSQGYHLGYCIDKSSRYFGAFTCWRCGGKSAVKVIAKITHSTESEAWKILKRYSDSKIDNRPYKKEEKEKAVKCLLPDGLVSFEGKVSTYLRKRKFDAIELVSEWDLKATGPVGPFKHRIIIPIYFKNQLVSFQGRDLTGKSEMKYKACPQEREVLDHKCCLYGYDKVRGSKVVVVEGVADVWRLGPGSVATFGIKYTPEQVRLLSKFKEAFIIFDNDPKAIEQAESLAYDLSAVGVSVEIITLKEGDPGDLTDQEARELMTDILGK